MLAKHKKIKIPLNLVLKILILRIIESFYCIKNVQIQIYPQ